MDNNYNNDNNADGYPQNTENQLPVVQNSPYQGQMHNADTAQYVASGQYALDNKMAKWSRQVAGIKGTILFIFILSAINVASYIFNLGFEFSFSLTSPLFLIGLGIGTSAAVTTTAIAIVIVASFLLLHFLAKKYTAAIVIALVIFTLDTVFLIGIVFLMYLGGFGADMISMLLPFLFHIWGMVLLIRATNASVQLKKYTVQQEPQLF
jgi:hypothetical protein